MKTNRLSVVSRQFGKITGVSNKRLLKWCVNLIRIWLGQDQSDPIHEMTWKENQALIKQIREEQFNWNDEHFFI